MHLRVCAAVTVALTLASGCVRRPAMKLDMPPFNLPGTDFQFDSGLRVLFQEDPSLPVVCVVTVVGAGSVDDPPGKEGLAHLVEHLYFRSGGTGNHVEDTIERVGGDFNAWTGVDSTIYETLAPAKALDSLLALETIRLINPLPGLTQEHLDMEREIVRAEMLERRAGQDARSVSDGLRTMAFPEGHPYHRTLETSQKSLESITLNDVRAFVAKHYRPANITIVISGAVDRANAGKTLSRVFPAHLIRGSGYRHPRSRADAVDLEPPRPPSVATQVGVAEIDQPVVYLAWSLPGGYGPDDVDMQLAMRAMELRLVYLLLYEGSRRTASLLEDVACEVQLHNQASLGFCRLDVAAGGDPEELLAAALRALEEQEALESILIRVSAETVRNDYINSVLTLAETPYRAIPLASDLHFRGETDLYSHELGSLQKIRIDSINAIRRKYLTRDRVVKLVIRPASRPLPMIALSSAARDRSADWAGAVVDRDLDDWFTTLRSTDVRAMAAVPETIETRQLTLENELRVVLIRRPGIPLVEATLMTGGGYLSVSPPGLTQLVSLTDRAPPPGPIAGRWSTRQYEDARATSIRAPSGNLDDALYLLARRIRTAHVPFRSRRRHARLERWQDWNREYLGTTSGWSRDVALHHLFGKHPAATSVFDPDALGQLGRGELNAWHHNAYAPANSVLIVVGDLKLDDAEALVRTRWGSWRKRHPGQPVASLPPASAPPAARIVRVRDVPDAPQTSVAITCRIDPQGSPASYEVLESVVERELNDLIRVETGASYGVTASVTRLPHAGAALRIETEVRSDQVGAALRASSVRMDAFRAGKVDPKILHRAVWQRGRVASSRFLSLDAVTATAVNLVRFGAPLSSLDGYGDRLLSVDGPSLGRLLEPCVGREAVTLAGPAAALKKQLADSPFAVSAGSK